jgi:hypothetical protein
VSGSSSKLELLGSAHRFSPRLGVVAIGTLLAAAASCRCANARSPSATGKGSEAMPTVRMAGATPTPAADAPFVAYTDVVAGPTSGGENNKGTYLSLFGVNFGSGGAGSRVKVLINDVEVDNYRYLGPSRGRSDIEQITVQVGALGKPRPGVPLPIKVVANGVASNTNNTFTVQPGDILFVSTHGDDATAARNDIKRPWRHVQTPSQEGALAKVQPGDVVVLRGGPGVIWSDVGYDNRWFRFRRVTGNAPTGEKGHGYISVLAYPGEDVRYVPPPRTSGGIHGIGEDYPELSDWIVVSGLHIESVESSQTDGAPINLQANSDHWRIVNNELGPWPSPASASNKAGGVAGNGKNNVVLGNHIHDIGGGQLNHGIYLDSACRDVEVAYNSIHDITGGNLIQTFDNIGERPLDGILIHHNLLHSGGRFGLNISGGTRSLAAWNNVIHSTALAAVRFSFKGEPGINIAIVHNTIFNANTVSSPGNGLIVNDDKLDSGAVLFQNNVVATGPKSRSIAYYLALSEGPAITFRRNLWNGLGPPPRQDADPVAGGLQSSDPRFTAAARRDFSLDKESAAVDQATPKNPMKITDDFRLKRRPSGAAADVGAFER